MTYSPTTFSPTDFPVIPFNATDSTQAPLDAAQIYYFKQFLNDIQPGLGDNWFLTNYGVGAANDYAGDDAYINSVLNNTLNGSQLQSTLNSAARADADAYTAYTSNNMIPGTVDIAAWILKQFVPDNVAPEAKPILDSIADWLRGLGLGNGGGDGGAPGNGGGTAPGGPGMGGGGPGNSGNAINNGNSQISPLVLDLTGTGLNLTALSSASPYFDLTNDGFARKTGWIGSGTGLLVLPNADGSVTNISNLFGNQNYETGFAALGINDSNSDGGINAGDTIYSQLRIWVDTNDNGVADSGELYTLAQLGITSINLNATSVNQTIAGNTVKYISSYTLSDGTTREIADVWFSNSPTYTQSDTTVTISSAIAALPELKGYGVMTDLQSKMMGDSTLVGLVQNFVALSSTADIATIASDVQAIMYEWGNATNPTVSYTGTGINSNQIAFLDNYTGVTFTYSAGAGPRQADNVAQAWIDAFDATEARLVLQSNVSAEVPEFTYNAGLDCVLPVGTLSSAFTAAYARLGNVTASNIASWTLEDQVANAFQMDLSVSQSSFEKAIAVGSTDTIASVANAVANNIQISFAGDGSIIETGVNIGSVFYAGAGISKIITYGAGSVPAGATNWQTTNDIVNYNAGDGVLEISGQGDYQNTSNTLAFGAGITMSDIVITQGSGNNVILTDGTSGDQITLDNMLTTNYDNGLDAVTFADGTSLTNYQIASAVLATGSATQTSLTDTLGNAIFDSKGYAHYESSGLSDGNTFIYNSGYGQLEISVADYLASPNNTLKFGVGITSSQITVSSDVYGDLLLTDGISGDQIKLDGMLGRAGDGVENLLFADGTSLSYQQVIALATTGSATNTSLYDGLGNATFDPNGYAHSINASLSGNNTFLYNQGYGSVEIQEQDESTTPDDILKFGAGISASQITVSSDASGNLLIGDGTSGDQITISGMLNNQIDGIAQIQFADGTSLSKTQLLTMATTGSATNTSLYDNLGGAVFNPAGYAHTMTSYANGNTFQYDAGDGNVAILEASFASTPDNVLQLGAGISESQVSFSQDSSGDLLIADGTSGDQIKVYYMLNNSRYGIQEIAFADGTIWGASMIQSMLAVANSNIVDSGGTVHYVSGSSSSNNTFIYNAGYGQLEITEYDYASAPNNILKFGTGITPSQISVSSDIYGDLLIRDGISGDQVNLYNMLGGNLWGIQEVQFSNGTILTKQQLITMATTGSATNTVLTDSLGNATFDPAGYASKINAVGTGNNTFVYNSGYGSVEISAYNSSSTNNVLAFGTGIAASQISITSDIYGDVLMTDGVTGDQVKLDDMVGSSHWGVQAVQFANGTAWNSTFLSSLKLGASGNDTLNGTTGNDTFYGSPGNDVMNGDGGYDSYNIGKNVVTTTINNAISGGTAANGEIDFLSGISDENLWFQQSGNNLEIERLGTTSQITISGWFGSNASAQVEKLTAGGLTLDNQVSQLVSAMATYAANNSGFNPATATSMPTDSTLQNAIAAAWHT